MSGHYLRNSSSCYVEISALKPRINTVSSLNCGTFAEKCGWANTNDEEMDWTTVQALPDAERYLSTLATENYPGSVKQGDLIFLQIMIPVSAIQLRHALCYRFSCRCADIICTSRLGGRSVDI